MKVLVICAHPDDEVLGVGGTMLKHSKKGDEVSILIVSEGVSAQYTSRDMLKARRDACLKAAKLLGAKGVIFKELPDARLDIAGQYEINKIIEDAVKEVRPQVAYTHHYADMHKDHRMIFESTMVAARPRTGTSIQEMYAYEILGSTNRGGKPGERFIPDTYVDISDELDEKIRAFKAYESEVQPFPHSRSIESIEVHAKFRGIEAGLKAAEAFVCIRAVKSENFWAWR